MILAIIEKQGDTFVVTISEDTMERLNLREGDEVVVQPVNQETRTALRPELQKAMEESWDRNEAGYRYLADR